MGSVQGWLWISEADVVSAMDMGDAIAAVRGGFAEEARGGAENMLKTYVQWGDGATLHAIGAAFHQLGYVGTKTWTHTPGGASPLLVLFRADDGAIAAIIEAFALGQLRTAAVSGVATDLLAVPTASELAIIGTGKQALAQVAAILAVRPIERVRVHSRDSGRREAFAARAQQTLGVKTVAAGSVEEAVDGAHVITLATRATEPFLDSRMVAAGAHVNALGAITPRRQEFEPALLDRCDVIGTDSVPQVREFSKEFTQHFGDDEEAWAAVRPLAECLQSLGGRPADADVTLTKAMGTGICDLALGIACYEAMHGNGLGVPQEQPQPIPPRLRAPGGASSSGYV